MESDEGVGAENHEDAPGLHTPSRTAKSSRHSKITGDFAEGLVLYWLSKYGYECARVDHTGIDLIARDPRSNSVWGISVKSRSRNEGAEGSYIKVPNDNFDKAEAACVAFGCVPYFAFVVDQGKSIWLFLLSMSKLLAMYPKGLNASGWYMKDRQIEEYLNDPEIRVVSFTHENLRW